jgi:hypothetical protein
MVEDRVMRVSCEKGILTKRSRQID